MKSARRYLDLLVLEDNRDLAEIFSDMLASYGFVVYLAYDGLQGLDHVEITTDPDNLASQRVIIANAGVLIERFDKGAAYGHLAECLTASGDVDAAADAYLAGIDAAIAHGHNGLAADYEAAMEALG